MCKNSLIITSFETQGQKIAYNVKELAFKRFFLFDLKEFNFTTSYKTCK